MESSYKKLKEKFEKLCEMLIEFDYKNDEIKTKIIKLIIDIKKK